QSTKVQSDMHSKASSKDSMYISTNHVLSISEGLSTIPFQMCLIFELTCILANFTRLFNPFVKLLMFDQHKLCLISNYLLSLIVESKHHTVQKSPISYHHLPLYVIDCSLVLLVYFE